MISQSSIVLGGIPLFQMVLAMKTLVVPHGVSFHLIWSFEIWLILDLLQDLIYWLSEHHVYHLRSRRPRLPSKIPSGPITIIYVRFEIPPVPKDNFSLSLPLLLVFLDPLVLINMIHKSTHTPYRLLGQGLSQIMLNRKAYLKSPYSHVIKVPIDLIEHLSVSIRVRLQGLPFSHGHGQQEI